MLFADIIVFKGGDKMDLVELPLKMHYCIFTHEGFSTFILKETKLGAEKWHVQDIPLRFCFNVMKADPSDVTMINAEKHFYERFKFFAIKYFGMPILADMRLKDVIREYEKPLEELMKIFESKNKAAIIKKIAAIDPINENKELEIENSPLFVFTRNSMPDLE